MEKSDSEQALSQHCLPVTHRADHVMASKRIAKFPAVVLRALIAVKYDAVLVSGYVEGVFKCVNNKRRVDVGADAVAKNPTTSKIHH